MIRVLYLMAIVPQPVCRYAGYMLKRRGAKIAEISRESKDLEPAIFWKKYVCRRKPVVIRGGIPDAAFKAPQLWTDDYLIKRAVSSPIPAPARTDPIAPGVFSALLRFSPVPEHTRRERFSALHGRCAAEMIPRRHPVPAKPQSC